MNLESTISRIQNTLTKYNLWPFSLSLPPSLTPPEQFDTCSASALPTEDRSRILTSKTATCCWWIATVSAISFHGKGKQLRWSRPLRLPLLSQRLRCVCVCVCVCVCTCACKVLRKMELFCTYIKWSTPYPYVHAQYSTTHIASHMILFCVLDLSYRTVRASVSVVKGLCSVHWEGIHCNSLAIFIGWDCLSRRHVGTPLGFETVVGEKSSQLLCTYSCRRFLR